MRKYLSVVSITSLIVISNGCSTMKEYSTNRVRDVRDAIILDTGIGLGIGADVRLGSLSHPSIGLLNAQILTVGSYERDAPFLWNEVEFYWPAEYILCVGLSEGNRDCLNSSYARSLRYNEGNGRLIDEQFLNLNNPYDPESTSLEKSTQFEIGASLIFLSGRAGVNLIEIGDFLLGFTTLDIMGDDKNSKTQSEQFNEPSAGGDGKPAQLRLNVRNTGKESTQWLAWE